MKLIWKLLRQHISVGQFVGFFFANLFGMIIVLLGFQFYRDVKPVIVGEDALMKSDYVVVEKNIGMGTTVSGQGNSFDKSEVGELEEMGFATRVGYFTSASYQAFAHIGINGTKVLNSEIFIESMPDCFVDIPLEKWGYSLSSKEVPVIMPQSYLAMYNFGFAQSRSLPKISDGLVGMVDFDILIQGNGCKDTFKGKVMGFSNRISCILVPQAFMDWSNRKYGVANHENPTRLILSIDNSRADLMAKYFDKKGYEVESDRLNTEKATFFLRLMVSIVMAVGAVISLLSFYILMLSIYLLVQKNSVKLENLLLIGYSPRIVAMPYLLISVGLNFTVLVIALCVLLVARSYYMDIIYNLFPDIDSCGIVPALLLGILLFMFVSIFNMITIRRKIVRIWKRREQS